MNISGYASHAAYVQEVMMAKNPETVNIFLSDLTTRFKSLWKKEKKAMLEIKRSETEETGMEFDGEIRIEDFR